MWRPASTAPFSLGGGGSPDQIAGHTCPLCTEAVDWVGSLGPTAMERSLHTHLRATDHPQAEQVAPGSVGGLVGWGAMGFDMQRCGDPGPAPNAEPRGTCVSSEQSLGPYSQGMHWRVMLDGEQPDLVNLAAWFPTGHVHVVRDDDGTHLMGPDLDAQTTAGDAYVLAEHWLRQINGTATALRGGEYWPARLAGKIRDLDRPQDVYAMGGTAHAVVRALGVAVGEVRDADGNLVPQPPPPGPRILDRSTQDRALAEALRWMGAPDGPNWAHLWKAFEVLREDAGGSDPALCKRSRVTKDEIASFRSSSNDHTISGDEARHAVQTRPAAPAMTIPQGRDFVGRLIRARCGEAG